MKAAFYTLGCKVNQYETEYMAELLRNAGFEIVKENDEADYYIVNSCTVTATADQKTISASINSFASSGNACGIQPVRITVEFGWFLLNFLMLFLLLMNII